MIKKIIKMNDNKNYLSFGNLCNIIKETAINKRNVNQVEVFCTLFNCQDINSTTVNNYCIGLRTIGIEYKKIYYDLKDGRLENNSYEMIIMKIISLLDDKIYIDNHDNITFINNHPLFKKVITKLITIMNNDKEVSDELKKEVVKTFENNDLYQTFILLINYIILDNRQPRYLANPIIYNESDLKEFLNLNLNEGIGYITSLQTLAQKGNVYANAELGSLEFSGFVSGKPDYEKCFEYYMNAAKKNHPKGCWMVANLIITNKIKKDFNIAWEYLKKAISLNSIAALNTMGNCFLTGLNPKKEINEDKALKFFQKAASENYKYAYNNIGLYYERHNDIKNALKYFKLSASLNESWALNKIGEYYRKENNLKEAYFYYLKASQTPIVDCNFYSYYNLAKYYFLCGNTKLNIKKDKKKAMEYLKIASEHHIIEAQELLEKLGEEVCVE